MSKRYVGLLDYDLLTPTPWRPDGPCGAVTSKSEKQKVYKIRTRTPKCDNQELQGFPSNTERDREGLRGTEKGLGAFKGFHGKPPKIIMILV